LVDGAGASATTSPARAEPDKEIAVNTEPVNKLILVIYCFGCVCLDCVELMTDENHLNDPPITGVFLHRSAAEWV